ncbi:MAG: hypothetical protein IPK32_18310 [Verrucomicrobiaceae bacterium]|nr:hypothetical protein [Verrucomicrobiaceae bacterium]
MKELFIEIRITAIALTLLLIVGWLTMGRSCASQRATDKKVSQVAERLDRQVDRGRYVRVAPESVSDLDSWGQRIRVEYRDEGLSERLLVSSSGPDKTFGTDDDVLTEKMLLNAKGLGEKIHDGAASTAKEATKGVIDGVAEKLKGALKKTKEKQP